MTDNPKKGNAVEEILCGNRFKILSALASGAEFHVPKIAERAQISQNCAREHLKFLVRAEIVRFKQFGRIKIYYIDSQKMRGQAVLQLFESYRKGS